MVVSLNVCGTGCGGGEAKERLVALSDKVGSAFETMSVTEIFSGFATPVAVKLMSA